MDIREMKNGIKYFLIKTFREEIVSVPHLISFSKEARVILSICGIQLSRKAAVGSVNEM